MRKGFTLIELLAVIVILAIIALIATPIVLNIINDTKESATIRGAGFYIDALQNEIALENIKQGGSFNPSECEIKTEDNVLGLYCDDKLINIKVDGEKPLEGSKITFVDGKVTSVNLKYQSGTVTQNNKGELVLGEAEPIIVGSATFNDGVTLTWEQLRLEENGIKYGYDASKITDTKLGDNAFNNCATLTSIIVPNNITSIGNSAFQDSALTKIVISEGVTSVGDYAFAGTFCEPIVLPDSITTLGGSIVEAGPVILNAPKSLTNIKPDTFYQLIVDTLDMSKCANLKTMYIGIGGIPGYEPKEYILPNSIETIVIMSSEVEQKIKFNGTIEEFENITIDYGEEDHGCYSIHINVECKDGTTTVEYETECY